MKNDNLALISVKYLLLFIAKYVLFFPVWWYSSGLIMVLDTTRNLISKAWKGLALGVWLKNIFTPMYGQYDAVSRTISFLMRVVQIIIRLIIMVFLLAMILLWPIFYLGLPLLVIWRLFIQ